MESALSSPVPSIDLSLALAEARVELVAEEIARMAMAMEVFNFLASALGPATPFLYFHLATAVTFLAAAFLFFFLITANTSGGTTYSL
jgi:hypothetical protein